MRTRGKAAPQRANSILAVDFGNTRTRAVLIDLVEGVYALIAKADEPTTGGFPTGDVSVGLARALRQLSMVTGRRFLDGEQVITPEQPDRSGVDLFVATASIGRPLRTILIGLVPGLSVTSGQRAAAGTYIDIVDTITLDDTRSEEDQLNAIIRAEPDLIFIVGGTEDGARQTLLEVTRSAQLAVRVLPQAARPVVLFAGNSAAAPLITAAFAPLTTVFTADNVRPLLDDEALAAAQLQLALAYDSATSARDTAFAQIGSMTRSGVLPNAQSYALIVNFLGRAQPGAKRMPFLNWPVLKYRLASSGWAPMKGSPSGVAERRPDHCRTGRWPASAGTSRAAAPCSRRAASAVGVSSKPASSTVLPQSTWPSPRGMR